MAVNHDSMAQLLANNVVELVFIKRTDGSQRRMLCTNNKPLLNSIAGKIALHFKPPKGVGQKYNPKNKGLITTYDLMWQDYRQVSLESANVITAIPLKTEEDINNFWQYFDQRLQDMSATEKLQFMRR